jgi:methyl-accepting chemotaxis protein
MKNLKVSMKLFTGFGITVALIGIVGVFSIVEMNGLNDSYSKTIDRDGAPLAIAGNILGAVHTMRAELRGSILFTGNREKVLGMKKSFDEACVNFEKNFAEFGKYVVKPETRSLMEESRVKYEREFKPNALKIIDGAENGLPVGELAAVMASSTKPAADLIAANMEKCMEVKTGVLREAQAKGQAQAQNILVMMLCIIAFGIAVAVLLGIYISAQISKPLSAAVKMLKEMGSGHLNERLRLDRADEIGVMAKTMDTFAENLQSIVVGTMKKISEGDLSTKISLMDDRDEIGAALKNTTEALRSLIIDDGGKVLLAAANKDMSQRLTAEYKGEYAKMKENINTVMQNLDDALNQVSETVAQVMSASGQIAGGAQNLAEGANMQASSLEEVSASLEEMSSMTKQNADNSNQAKILASEARAAANDGDASMKRMANAINEIKVSADNTAKIIKTIDDIAFQTNLLALNAAVEAARAGEAGKGFAVVAEEVRNLAMRSAEAAKNTADMIEASVKNADGGVKITEEVAKSLGQIVNRTQKVGDLIAEIAAASNEQAQGIEQVNTAVASMNQVTQSNAANSEESASASEELSSQAAELANMVGVFTLSGSSGNRYGQNIKRGLPLPQKNRACAALPNNAGKKPKAKVAGGWVAASFVKKAKAVKAEAIIPLDDEELRGF